MSGTVDTYLFAQLFDAPACCGTKEVRIGKNQQYSKIQEENIEGKQLSIL
jgi:hypothetical protein